MIQRFFVFQCLKPSLLFIGLLFCLFVVSSVTAQQAVVEIDTIYSQTTDNWNYDVGSGPQPRPGFPSYIISRFHVLNEHGHNVRDLASTERWLSERDMIPAQGRSVHTVWTPIKEYWHQDFWPDRNTPVPSEENQIVNQFYVREVDSLATSVVLVMDYSSSMDDSTLYPAIEGAKAFITEVKKPEDRMSILTFHNEVTQQIGFTDVDSALINAIPGNEARDKHTALYRAIMNGIDAVNTEGASGERNKVVIVYTDGNDEVEDSTGDPTVDEIIKKAKDSHVSVYCLGIHSFSPGDTRSAQEYQENMAILNRITWETTGVKLKMDGHNPYELESRIIQKTREEWLDAYKTIYSLLPSYYLLAGITTDPRTNGILRTVDITVRSEGVDINGVGHYEPPDALHDIAVKKQVFLHGETDTTTYADPGNIVDYRVLISNESDSSISGEVQVTDVYPDSMVLMDFVITPEPLSFNVDTLNRTIHIGLSNLFPRDSVVIKYSAKIDSTFPAHAQPMVNVVQALASDSLRDKNRNNNIGTTKIDVNGIPDFSVSAVCLNGTEPISPGYPFDLEAIVTNVGHTEAVMPFHVSFYVENLTSGTDEKFLGDVLVTRPSPNEAVLDTNASRPVFYSWTPAEVGRYLFRVVVDRNGEIRESNESNNSNYCETIDVDITDLTLQISDMSITDAVPGMQAGFPDSVLSRVIVLDQNGNPVKNLASLSRWIEGEDATDHASTVAETWIKLQEFDRYTPGYPETPDATGTIRVREAQNAAFSLALSLDARQSLSHWETRVEAVVEALIRRMTSDDEMLLFNVNEGTEAVQGLTNNETVLTSKIRTWAYNKTSSRLYANLPQAMASIGPEGGRNAVLAIAGADQSGQTGTAETLINEALERGVPLFLIQLEGADSAELSDLCEQSGGQYWRVSTLLELEEAVVKTERSLRNFYWLRHASPDPLKNQKWRTVDLGIEAQLGIEEKTLRDEDISHYRAAKGVRDAAVRKTSTIGRGSHSTAQNVTGSVVMPLDTIHYAIELTNTGDYTLHDLNVIDFLPDSLASPRIIDALSHSWLPDSIAWHLDSLQVSESAAFHVDFVVDTLWLSSEMELINSALLRCVEDSSGGNDLSVDTLTYRPLPVPDLGISKTAAVSHDADVGYLNLSETEAQPGEIIEYTITVTNRGGQMMRDITITDYLPEALTLIEFDGQLQSQTGDTLTWHLDDIYVGQSETWRMLCQVDSVNYPTGTDMPNRVRVDCGSDTLTDNNEAVSIVDFRALTPVDLRIRKSAAGDSTGVDGRKFVHVGSFVEYTVTVINDGQLACSGMTLTDQIPDLLQLVMPPANSTSSGGMLQWTHSGLTGRDGAVRDSITFSYSCQAGEERDTLAIVNAVSVQSADESEEAGSNNSAAATVYLIPIRPKPPTLYVMDPRTTQADTTNSQQFPSNSSHVRLELISSIDIEAGHWSLGFYKGDMDDPCEAPDVTTYSMGSSETNFALNAGEPFYVIVDSAITRLCPGYSKQTIFVVLETEDEFGFMQSANTQFMVESVNRFVLDRNVFRPGVDDGQYSSPELRLSVQLKEIDNATLIIYDISGGFIKELRNTEFPTWEVYTYWDGRDEQGNIVGSGVYIAVLSSDVFKKARKFIVVR